MNLVSKYSGGFPYGREDICYIEVRKDGTVVDFPHRSACDMTFVEEAHFQAMYKGSKIYASLMMNKRNVMYEVDDLDAFAKAFALKHYARHKHSFHWSTKETKDMPYGATVWITIKMYCGCLLNERNLDDFAQLVKEHLGWEVVQSEGVGPSYNTKCDGRHFTIEVIRSTIKGKSGNYNVPKKRYC